MDIEKGTEKLTHIDNFLSILKTLLKKHWGKPTVHENLIKTDKK